ncbi:MULTISPECIES: NAD(+)/NADH kinase [Micromonospora]|uniref:NAD kinase n=1 Tax=Micromonospora solifontis TaxID=2487138 RepID=A0ABX9WA26_9ACTN|nr:MULTISPECIES: NAD(+)/NADH kinase [Micromonospora]NES15484.1 NAD(+)/NADH kinase [Micromonospora sp. PPF5-17B]NES39308.1 NAD(+)/NADH kinase [Micromonospora solifontis]NES55289.1 NAD(+)/NADH kinase [Micromonospora sp. PPF5-6]RNL89602.1 NAD(+)/NADH kinase [Micromonospora solifontis]
MAGYVFGLILHPTRDVAEVVGIIERWAAQHGKTLAVRTEDRHRVPGSVEAVPAEQLAARSDALISIGGDGTMLGALRSAIRDPKPVLGVHLGRLGFLVEVEPPELPRALERLVAHDFTVESHACLACDVCGDDVVAFNDIALVRHPGAGFVTATLAVDGQRYGYYRCDALVVSTPTGSTAYSYAAGGPLISPATQAVVVTPSAPMAGISRSVVLSPDETVHLELRPDSAPVAVEMDGLVIREAATEGAVHVRYVRDAGLVVRLDPRRYQERNQLKLSLLDLPLLPDQLRELLPDGLREQLNRRELPPPR